MTSDPGLSAGGVPMAELAEERPTITRAMREGWRLLQANTGPLILLSLVFLLLSGIIILNFLVMGGFYAAVVTLRRGGYASVNNLLDHWDRFGQLIVCGLIGMAVGLVPVLVVAIVALAVGFLIEAWVGIAFGVLGLLGFLAFAVALNTVFVPAFLLIVERQMDAVPAIREAWRITTGLRGTIAGFNLIMFAIFFPLLLIPLVGLVLSAVVYTPVLYGGMAYFWEEIRQR